MLATLGAVLALDANYADESNSAHVKYDTVPKRFWIVCSESVSLEQYRRLWFKLNSNENVLSVGEFHQRPSEEHIQFWFFEESRPQARRRRRKELASFSLTSRQRITSVAFADRNHGGKSECSTEDATSRSWPPQPVSQVPSHGGGQLALTSRFGAAEEQDNAEHYRRPSHRAQAHSQQTTA